MNEGEDWKETEEGIHEKMGGSRNIGKP